MSKTVAYAQWLLEPYCIGLKLRALRNQKRLTLSQLAAETGLSTALLSKLETDRMIPTLPTLATIGRVYGVGMSHFFSEHGRHTVSITRKAHLEGASRGPENIRTTPLNTAADPSLQSTRIRHAWSRGCTTATLMTVRCARGSGSANGMGNSPRRTGRRLSSGRA